MTYDPTSIVTADDLKALNRSGVINGDIIIRGQYLKKLEEVTRVQGFLGISNASITSLGELKEVTGDFWIGRQEGPALKSLGNLQRVGGDLSLRYSSITDLGNLEHVGGKVSLRDTKIQSLGKLRSVGGDLFLPKRLQDSIDLSGIDLKGRVRYWNDDKASVEVKSGEAPRRKKVNVPYWPHQYVFSSDALRSANPEQFRFYQKLKKSFHKGDCLDHQGNDNYPFILFYELIDDYEGHRDLSRFQSEMERLSKCYPKTGGYSHRLLIEEFQKRGDHRTAWSLERQSDFISVQAVLEYHRELGPGLLDGDLVIKLGGYSHLTDFGQNNVDKIKPFVPHYLTTYEAQAGVSFFDQFFELIDQYPDARRTMLLPNRYAKFYVSEAAFRRSLQIVENQRRLTNRMDVGYLLEGAIRDQCRVILKKAEDLYRVSIGMPQIGEGWISETELFYRLTEAFSEHEVVHHGKPSWLGRQHLDIYFPRLNIAVEYQGLQHYEPVDFFGGHEAFERNQERDQRKRSLCEMHGCALIYVNSNYDFDLVVEEIKKVVVGRHMY